MKYIGKRSRERVKFVSYMDFPIKSCVNACLIAWLLKFEIQKNINVFKFYVHVSHACHLMLGHI